MTRTILALTDYFTAIHRLSTPVLRVSVSLYIGKRKSWKVDKTEKDETVGNWEVMRLGILFLVQIHFLPQSCPHHSLHCPHCPHCPNCPQPQSILIIVLPSVSTFQNESMYTALVPPGAVCGMDIYRTFDNTASWTQDLKLPKYLKADRVYRYSNIRWTQPSGHHFH